MEDGRRGRTGIEERRVEDRRGEEEEGWREEKRRNIAAEGRK